MILEPGNILVVFPDSWCVKRQTMCLLQQVNPAYVSTIKPAPESFESQWNHMLVAEQKIQHSGILCFAQIHCADSVALQCADECNRDKFMMNATETSLNITCRTGIAETSLNMDIHHNAKIPKVCTLHCRTFITKGLHYKLWVVTAISTSYSRWSSFLSMNYERNMVTSTAVLIIFFLSSWSLKDSCKRDSATTDQAQPL